MTYSQPPTKKARRDDTSMTVYERNLAAAKKAFMTDFCVIHQRAAYAATAAQRIVEHQSVMCRQPDVVGKSVAQALVEKFENTSGDFQSNVKKFIAALDGTMEDNGNFCNWLGPKTPKDFNTPFTIRGKLMAWDLVLLALQHFTLSSTVQAALNAYDSSTDATTSDSVARLTFALDDDPYIADTECEVLDDSDGEEGEKSDSNDDDE
jgi:hypothetical protein